MAQLRKMVGDPYRTVAASLRQAVENAATKWGVDPEIAGDVSLADERAGMAAASRQDSGPLQVFVRVVDRHILSRFDAFVAAYEAAGAPYGETVAGILRWHAEVTWLES